MVGMDRHDADFLLLFFSLPFVLYTQTLDTTLCRLLFHSNYALREAAPLPK